jgi:pimeloyl-ACP methyl ester carboxylesterase
MNQPANTDIPKTLFRKGIRYRQFHDKRKQKNCLLLHGLGNSLDFWDDVFCGLSHNVSVVSLDIPGSGRSPLPKAGGRLLDIAEAIYAFLHDLEIQRTTIIAHSFGVATALTLTQRYPKLVERIVIVDGTLQTADAIVKRPHVGLRHPRVAITLAAQLVSAVFDSSSIVYSLVKSTPATRYLALLPFVANPSSISQQTWDTVFSDNAGVSLLQTLGEIRGLDFTELMLSVSAPVTLIWGARDSLITSDDISTTKSLMNVDTLRELPNCGHWPMLEMPETFVASVMSSLE